MPFFYLARCADGSLYCGACNELQAREAAHNSGKGAKYTRSRLPVRMVYAEEFPTLGDALRREAEVKKWKKARKERLLSSTPSTLQCTHPMTQAIFLMITQELPGDKESVL